MTSGKTLFISDLHLEETQPLITQHFLQLLTTCQSDTVDALYILGDLFESWVGDDNDSSFHREIIAALRSTAQKGVPVYFLCGNRDFLIGKEFASATQCELLAEETKINLYGTPLLLMHGDTLCTQDKAYQKARKKMRHRWVQKLFLLLPLKMRKNIADRMRKKSMHYVQSAPLELMDVTQSAVENVMRKHQVLHLIHGHTHRPGFHQFSLDRSPATRIVLGAWHNRGNVLIWDESGKKDLVEFP